MPSLLYLNIRNEINQLISTHQWIIIYVVDKQYFQQAQNLHQTNIDIWHMRYTLFKNVYIALQLNCVQNNTYQSSVHLLFEVNKINLSNVKLYSTVLKRNSATWYVLTFFTTSTIFLESKPTYSIKSQIITYSLWFVAM